MGFGLGLGFGGAVHAGELEEQDPSGNHSMRVGIGEGGDHHGLAFWDIIHTWYLVGGYADR